MNSQKSRICFKSFALGAALAGLLMQVVVFKTADEVKAEAQARPVSGQIKLHKAEAEPAKKTACDPRNEERCA